MSSIKSLIVVAVEVLYYCTTTQYSTVQGLFSLATRDGVLRPGQQAFASGIRTLNRHDPTGDQPEVSSLHPYAYRINLPEKVMAEREIFPA